MPTIAELKVALKAHGLRVSGSKAELQARLRAYEQTASSSCAGAASSSGAVAAKAPSHGQILSLVTGRPVPEGQGAAWPTHIVSPGGATPEEEQALMRAAHLALTQHAKDEEKRMKQSRREIAKHGYMGIGALKGAFVDADIKDK